MSRIPLVDDPDSLTAEQRPIYESIITVGGRRGRIPAPYQLTFHCPELTDKFQQMGGLLRYRTSLPLRISELAILVTARHWSCQFEWYAHAPVARQAGLDEAVIEAIRNGKEPPLLSPDEAAIYAYSRELLETHFVSESTHRQIRELFGIKGAIELTALMGYYVMVAMALNGHDYPLPDDAKELLPAL